MGFGDRVGGVIEFGERTAIKVGLASSTRHLSAFSPLLPPGFFSFLNYINFWSILALQAIWT